MEDEREAYDQSITIFSPDGRLYQVEYAREAVSRGSISVGLIFKSGVMLMAEKRIHSSLVVPDSIEKIFKIGDYIACSTSGLIADARVLINYVREEKGNYKSKYNEDILIVELVNRISNLKRIYTQYGGTRPFGVSFLFGGIVNMGICLFETDPSGAYKQYRAGAIGEGKFEIEKIFEEKHKTGMSLKDAINLTLNAITGGLNKNIDDLNFEIVTITKKDLFRKLTEDEVNTYKKSFLDPN